MYTIESAIQALSDDVTTLEAQIEFLENKVTEQTVRAKALGYKRVANAARIKLDKLVETQEAYIELS